MMKKIIMTMLILAYGASTALASFTFVNAGSGGSSGSTTTVTATVAGVHVGDLVVCMIKWESTTTTETVKDSSLNAFTQTSAGIKNINSGFTTAAYLLSSPIAGSIVYTATLGAARTFKDFVCQAWTPSGTASLDGTPAATTSATVGSSGNMTTTGTDGVSFGYYGETGSTPSNEQINSIAADQITHGGSASHSSLWSKTYSSGFTGAATVTVASNYNGGIISFKNTASVASHINQVQGVSTITGVSTLN